jgi:hypothetical protein
MEGKPLQSSRAPRFQIEMTLRFRKFEEVAWYEGTTVNISRSGVLFRAPKLMEVDTPVEVSFTLPVNVSEQGRAVVFCRGRIVRSALVSPRDVLPSLAAEILEYRFQR